MSSSRFSPAFVLPFVALACSANDQTTAAADRPSDAGADVAVESTVDAPAGDAPLFEMGAGTCATYCSPDARSVIDCNGQPTSCALDEACEKGACAPSCAAASANKSSIGCEYYAVMPETDVAPALCFAVYVVNRWTQPMTITADY